MKFVLGKLILASILLMLKIPIAIAFEKDELLRDGEFVTCAGSRQYSSSYLRRSASEAISRLQRGLVEETWTLYPFANPYPQTYLYNPVPGEDERLMYPLHSSGLLYAMGRPERDRVIFYHSGKVVDVVTRNPNSYVKCTVQSA